MKNKIGAIIYIICCILFFVDVIYLNILWSLSPLKGIPFVLEYKAEYIVTFVLIFFIVILGGKNKWH